MSLYCSPNLNKPNAKYLHDELSTEEGHLDADYGHPISYRGILTGCKFLPISEVIFKSLKQIPLQFNDYIMLKFYRDFSKT